MLLSRAFLYKELEQVFGFEQDFNETKQVLEIGIFLKLEFAYSFLALFRDYQFLVSVRNLFSTLVVCTNEYYPVSLVVFLIKTFFLSKLSVCIAVNGNKPLPTETSSMLTTKMLLSWTSFSEI